MGVDLKRLFKRMPPNALQAYFDGMLRKDIDWSERAARLSADLVAAIDQLGPEDRASIHFDFDRIAQFRDESSRRVLASVCFDRPELAAAMDQFEGVEAAALALLRAAPDLFDRALSRHYSAHHQNRRDWSGLEITGRTAIRLDISEKAIAALGRRLADSFSSIGTSRRNVRVDCFPCHHKDPLTGERREQFQFSIYVEQPTENYNEFASGTDLEIVRKTMKRLAEAAVVVEPGQRSLDITAAGGQGLRRAIAEAFLDEVVEGGAEARLRTRRRLDLDRLRQPVAFPLLPEDRVLRTSVECLWLAAPDAGGGLVMIERKAAEGDLPDSLHASVRRWFGSLSPLDRPGWRVIAARIRLVFEGEGRSRREKSVAIELKDPDRLNLRDQARAHRLIAERLLERWGLYHDAETAAAAA